MKNIKISLMALSLALVLFSCNIGKKKASDDCCSEKKSTTISETIVPEWSHDASIYEVNIRQFTPEGTFNAFAGHLPRLQELGVEILWLMPVHPIGVKGRKGTLGSYYSVKDYKAVSSEFGTMEEFKSLVSQAHLLGMKVILDWVANHTAWDHEWITKNPEWYSTDSLGKIIAPVADWSDVADLNYENREMRAAMIDAMKFWVAEADIDGFRCDVAGWVPDDFWAEATQTLNPIKPLFMLAEDEGNLNLLVKSFNMNYSWTFHHIMNRIAKGEAGVPQVKSYFERADTTYPAGSYAMQFTSSHDENSWNGSEYERLGLAVKTMAALSFTVPGMPMIYSGQEAALEKRLEFFEKDPINWDNLEMQEFYKKLIELKKNNKALWNGTAGGGIHFLSTSTENELLVFSRRKEGNEVIVLANLSPEPIENEVVCCKYSGPFLDWISGDSIDLDQTKKVELKGWEYKILVSGTE